MANFDSTVGYFEGAIKVPSKGQSQPLQGADNLQHMNQETQQFDPLDFLASEEEFDDSCEDTGNQADNFNTVNSGPSTLEYADSVIQTHESLQTISSKTNTKKRKAEQPLKYAFLTRSKTDILEDGYKWRKYGKKFVKNSPNPRNYFRCSNSNCDVKKTVERHAHDEGIVITTYLGKHNHESPCVIYYIGKPEILQLPSQTTSSPIEHFSGI